MGYVSEVVKNVIDYAFTSNNVIKKETGYLCDNQYSERIMIKSRLMENGMIELSAV